MRVISFLAVLLLAATTRAADAKFVNEQYDLQTISDNVYSFIAPESDSGVVQSNCTVIIGAHKPGGGCCGVGGVGVR